MIPRVGAGAMAHGETPVHASRMDKAGSPVRSVGLPGTRGMAAAGARLGRRHGPDCPAGGGRLPLPGGPAAPHGDEGRRRKAAAKGGDDREYGRSGVGAGRWPPSGASSPSPSRASSSSARGWRRRGPPPQPSGAVRAAEARRDRPLLRRDVRVPGLGADERVLVEATGDGLPLSDAFARRSTANRPAIEQLPASATTTKSGATPAAEIDVACASYK